MLDYKEGKPRPGEPVIHVDKGRGSAGAVAVGPEAKENYMVGVMQGEGPILIPPREDQWSTPTSRPRKEDARGRQIDFMACRRAESDHLKINVNSYRYVGSDQEGITQTLNLKLSARQHSAAQ